VSLENLYYNLSTRQWVASFDSPNQTANPTWGYGDARDFSVTFLQNTGARSVEVVQSVVGVQIALSDPSTPGTVLTSATAGTAVNNAFPFVLNLTGAGMATFMSGVVTPKNALLEFRVSTALGTNRYGSTIAVRPQQISDVTADPAAADRAIGFNEAGGIFVPKEWPAGMRMVMTTDSGRRFLFYPRDDGSFSGDEI